VRAFQLVAWQKPPELREVPVPEPGLGQILVKVGGAGACHSDLHLMERPAPKRPLMLPFTLGHERLLAAPHRQRDPADSLSALSYARRGV